MIDMPIKIGVLAPYPHLEKVIQLEAAAISDIEVEVVVCDVVDAVQPAKRMEQNGFLVLISRGATADTLRKHVKVPIIDIEVSAYDILRTLLLIKDSEEKIKLIGYPSVCRGVVEVSKLLDMQIPYTEVRTSEEVRKAVKDAWKNGYNTVLGDAVALNYIEEFTLQGIMITSGKEAVHQSLTRAKEVAQAINETRKEISSFHALIDTQSEGVIIFELDGTVNFANREFYSLFSLDSTIHSVYDLEQNYEGVFRRIIEAPYSIKTAEVNGKMLLIEVLLLEESSSYFVVKFTEENKYYFHSDELSFSHLRSTIFSFSQLCQVNQKVREAIIQLKSSAHKPVLLLTGEEGTGKKSLTSAFHYYKNGYTEEQWAVTIGEMISEGELSKLHATIQKLKGTFYIRGWEELSPCQIKKLVKSFSCCKDNTAVFSTNNCNLSERITENFDTSVHLPPLRDQLETFEEYTRKFIARYNNLYGKQVVGLSEDLLCTWKQKEWKRNLAELNEGLETGVYNAEGPYIQKKEVSHTKKDISIHSVDNIDFTKTLVEIEEDIIRKVVEEENYNQTRAAKRLGINRATLWRKLKNI